MTDKEREMYNKTFKRPKNFFKLSVAEQWIIDEKLGIPDWKAKGMNDVELKKYQSHYGLS